MYLHAFFLSRLSFHMHACQRLNEKLWESRNIEWSYDRVWQVRMVWCRVVCMMFRWPCRRRPDSCCFRTPRALTISAVWRESHQLRSPVRFIHSFASESVSTGNYVFYISTVNPWTLNPNFTSQTSRGCSLDVYMTLNLEVYRGIRYIMIIIHLPIYGIEYINYNLNI